MFRFRLLGEVSVTAGDQPVDIGHARQRAVLAVLLLGVNRPVPADTLVDRVWGDRLPRRPREALYGYLSRLRAVVPISRRQSGYVLTADPLNVDVHHFRELTSRAQAIEDDEDALTTLDAALALWQGDPFTGLGSGWLSEVRDDLERRRRTAELDRNDLRLRLGLHGLVLADAHTQSTTNERLAGRRGKPSNTCGGPSTSPVNYSYAASKSASSSTSARPPNHRTTTAKHWRSHTKSAPTARKPAPRTASPDCSAPTRGRSHRTP